MSLVLAPKSPLEVVYRIVDWTPELGVDAINSSTVTVTSGTVTVTNPQFGATAVIFTVSGGAQGETATFLNTITTVGGQTLEQELSMYIEAESVETPFGPSTQTKGDVLNIMWRRLGMSPYVFDTEPEETAAALSDLDLMMAAAPFRSLQLGYNFPPILGQSDPLDALGVADTFAMTIALKLAELEAPTKGKTLAGPVVRVMNAGMNNLLAQAQAIPVARMKGNTPLGSGSRWNSIWRPYAGSWGWGWNAPWGWNGG